MEKYIFRDGRFTARIRCPYIGKEWGYGDDDERMQRRIDKFVVDYARARKFRKRPLAAEPRVFPPKYAAAEMSTLQYVMKYIKFSGAYSSGSFPSDAEITEYLKFFKPLSDQVTPIPPGYYDDPVAEPLDD